MHDMKTMHDTKIWPKQLRLSKDKRVLSVEFTDGATFDLSAEYLRIQSPSAEVQGHAADQRITVPGKRDVEIMNLTPVGRYAVRITFTDLHDSGLYSWNYLHELGRDRDALWTRYLRELDEQGLSR